ncbi:Signal transduction histidine-protein kinase/phosphatase DegS [Arthrobacter ulcerisalmonis]|uniref:Oxygen sensor histidine kinase NreB n=2 Tax=Arthrobacter ulcerisalmonis TaxID=2483813 RepID=A0A3P5XCQ7_9MICC|nr:sensor histidine kinase [Arthrobacter ulcerisalmonis]VDC26309.1 Signal transduction histidine-protein kinase/phosphatase DegS [Arthrobacter ulcerisalmonis]
MPANQPAAPTAAILRVLRLTLHIGFAILLAVAVVRLLMGAADGAARVLLTGLALLLATIYVAGTALEKRFAVNHAGFDPRRFGLPWLGLVTVLWAILLAASADFAWLAFPLFFLHLHLLSRRVALITITLMTAAVVGAQWLASGLAVPHAAVIIGPVLGAAFSVVTGLAYRALYVEAENQRLAADELRRTRAELAAAQHNTGVLAERSRLAREIHDTLAQGLSSIVLMSRAATKSLQTDDVATASARLEIVQQTAASNLAEARNFVRGLSAPQLQDASLADSLRRLCVETESTAAAQGVSLRCRFELDGPPADLPQPHAVTLLRAAQASLANVAAHAHATNAVVTLAFLGTEVTLDIYDDGIGFDPTTAPAAAVAAAGGRGFGIGSLRERVGILEGTLTVESAPGEGTVVGIRLPLLSGQSPA